MSTKTRKNRAPLNLLMGAVGLAAIIALLLAAALDAATYLVVPIVLLLLASLLIMFLTRRSDEYTLGLWSSGANAAFLVIVAFALFAPFIEGVYDGFVGAHEETGGEQDFPAEVASYGAILAFYIVFNIKRLTGAL